MASEFVVYVDESGDEGFKFLDSEAGSSRWFVLSAVVVRRKNDLSLVKLLKDARQKLGKQEKKALHFRTLKHEMRIPYVELIASAPIKIVNILVHKPSIKNPENFQQEAHKLYRYLTRLLLERVSWLCRDHATNNDGTAEIIFSNRSAMSYDDLKNYIDILFKTSANGGDIHIVWSVISKDRVKAINHDQLAGLQVVDAIASSVFFAVNKTQYGYIEERYLKIINKLLYRYKNDVNGYGLKIWCNDQVEMKRLAEISKP